jgi:hypothetical protein
MKDNPDFGLPNLLNSFIKNTTVDERQNSEFLIKFDEDDNIEDIKSILDLYWNLNIKPFFWERLGGRSSLHEVQTYLYKYKNPNCTWIQVIADDFAIDFADWIRVCKLKQRPYDFENVRELLEIYKEEKEL